jgi:uncharacterized membrane protein
MESPFALLYSRRSRLSRRYRRNAIQVYLTASVTPVWLFKLPILTITGTALPGLIPLGRW